MLFSYIKIAFRSHVKTFLFSFINIAGLGLGLACAMLIGLYIEFELEYDTHFTKANRIYRIPTTLGSYETPSSPLPLIQVLTEQFPEVESAARLFKSDVAPYINANEINGFQEKASYYADSTLFDVFSFHFLSGDPSTALKDLHSVVLSESAAIKYFGSTDVLNKTIRKDNKDNFRITGVFRDLPLSTHFDASFIFSSLSSPLMNDFSAANWDWLYANYTYIVLRDGSSSEHLNKALKTIFWEITKNNRETYGADYYMYLQPLTNIHLGSHLDGELKSNGNKSTLITLGSIGCIILIIACINFMNLSTAGSIKRGKEVGMRKVMGVQRRNLAFQFLIESIVICTLSGLVAFFIISLSITLFNDITRMQIQFIDLLSFKVLGSLSLLVVGVGILSGIYPAFFLSGFHPVRVLKGNFSNDFGAIRIRKILVITQFAIGCALLVVTFIIGDQLSFMLGKDLGFEKEKVIILRLPNDTIGVDKIKTELLTVSGVKEVAKISDPFSNISGWLIWNYEGAHEGTTLATTRFHADEDLLKVMDIGLSAGRYYTKDHKADSNSVVINETAARTMGWTPTQAIGKRMGPPERSFFVIGVLKDFHFRPLSAPITPFVMYQRKNFSFEKSAIALRLDGNSMETIERIEAKWNALVPDWPFQFDYLKHNLDQQYLFERRLSKLTSIFSYLAILIAGLGLMGLASFSVKQKEKEIGIRKVLGASTNHLVTITTREFIKLVLLGVLIALPIAYFASEEWLNMYAYREPFSSIPFLLSLIISMVIATVTVSLIAWRASVADPVNTLRSE